MRNTENNRRICKQNYLPAKLSPSLIPPRSKTESNQVLFKEAVLIITRNILHYSERETMGSNLQLRCSLKDRILVLRLTKTLGES